jgi:uncharacterized protein Yka (UPF0111/DUF47 family)
VDHKDALKLLRELIDKVLEASRKKRVDLFRDPNSTVISIEVYLNDKQAAKDYFNELFDTVKVETANEVQQHFEEGLDEVLNSMSGTPSIARLERLLNNVRRELTIDLVNNIISEINKDKIIIEDISDRIQISIDKLNDAAQIFGTIAVILNVFTGIVTLSTGKINGIFKILGAIS